jgi:O-acetylserine/cysteine efflux transporter
VADPAPSQSGEGATQLTAQDIGIALVMNLMWGLNLIAVKIGVDLISPMTAAFLRQAMVLVICLPMLRIVPGKMRELLALGCLSGAVFYVVVNLSLAASDNVSALAIAAQLGAPFSLILAVLVLKERIHRARVGGMLLSFAGVALLVFDPAIVNERLGLALTALASLIWAVCSLIQRRLKGVPVLTIYAWVGCIGSLVLLPVAAVAEPVALARVPDLPLSTLGWVLFSALGSTVIGQGAMSLLLQRHNVSTVVPLTLLTPVISVIAGVLYLQAPLTPVMILGGIIVMIGVAIVTIRTAQAVEAEERA